MTTKAARDKRPFGCIRKLPSGRYQALISGPRGRTPAPHTFASRVDAEGWLHQRRSNPKPGSGTPTPCTSPPR